MFYSLLEHVALINAALNATMVVIWAVYLQLFLTNHLQQSRSTIHIDLGAAQGVRSRCLVTNLSSGPLYVQGIIADLSYDGQTSRTIITDRDEVEENEEQDPMVLTNRGTLVAGQTVDIGSLVDLAHRARIRLDENWSADNLNAVTITVVAISGQVERIVGASKEFHAESLPSGTAFSARRILTKQIRPGQTRKEYSKLLQDRHCQSAS